MILEKSFLENLKEAKKEFRQQKQKEINRKIKEIENLILEEVKKGNSSLRIGEQLAEGVMAYFRNLGITVTVNDNTYIADRFKTVTYFNWWSLV